MKSRPWLALAGSLVLMALAACGAAAPDRIRVSAIANDSDDEQVPCAVYVDGVLAQDADHQMVTTPATIPVFFRADPTSAGTSQPIQIIVYPLITKDGKLALPREGANEAPDYRVDGFARRLVRSSDARTLLFILQRNNDRKSYPLPRTSAAALPNN